MNYVAATAEELSELSELSSSPFFCSSCIKNTPFTHIVVRKNVRQTTQECALRFTWVCQMIMSGYYQIVGRCVRLLYRTISMLLHRTERLPHCFVKAVWTESVSALRLKRPPQDFLTDVTQMLFFQLVGQDFPREARLVAFQWRRRGRFLCSHYYSRASMWPA